MGRWIRGQLPPRLEDQSSDASAPQLVCSNRGPVCSVQSAAGCVDRSSGVCYAASNEAGVLRRV
jgi:hypothetical protein